MERNIWCGDGSITAVLPDDTRVLRAPPSLPALDDPEAAVYRALEEPIGQQPLRSLVGPGSKVTIAFGALSITVVALVASDFSGLLLLTIIRHFTLVCDLPTHVERYSLT